jgi:flavin-dependent dehydrogenase
MEEPMTNDHDVVIVGGSLAGCAAAILLGRQGLSVAVLERAADPAAYKKVCTHFIQASANPTLRRLGIEDALVAAGARPNRAEAWTPLGWMPWMENEEVGYNVRREVLDPMLRDLAARTPGVTLLLGSSAKAVIEEDGRIAGVIAERKDEPPRELRARLVIGADGRQGRLGDLAGVPSVSSAHGRFLYFAYYEGLELASGDASMIWFGNPDAAYCFPNDANLTVVAVMPTKDKLPAFRADLEAAFVSTIEALPHGPKLRGARRVSEIMGMIEMPNHVRPAAARGMAFIGDAALTSDPIYGVGCGWALQSAQWLADAVGPALLAGGDLPAALDGYAARHAAELKSHHALIADQSSGRRFNLIERVLFRGVARDRTLARGFQRMAARVIQPREFLTPRTMLRLLWVNLSNQPPLALAPRSHSLPR